MDKTVLLIDGENLRHYIEEILNIEGYKKLSIGDLDLDLDRIFKKVLKKIKLNKKNFYSAKLHFCERTPVKSKLLIEKQRILKSKLERQGFEFVISGHVRQQIVTINKKEKTIFKEKGVDVRLAVEMVSMACDKKYGTIILCSSDSDLQPAVKEARKRGMKIIYLGFKFNPNIGLTYTTNKTILIKNEDIVEAILKK